jgi:hypothetical protein
VGALESIRADEFHALDALLDHPVDGITAAAAHANHLDAGERF